MKGGKGAVYLFREESFLENAKAFDAGFEFFCFMVVGGGDNCRVTEFLGLELELELEKCMRDLILWVLCWVKNLDRRIGWDCGSVIRSRGRWGKCG